jgi:hypothetical protein
MVHCYRMPITPSYRQPDLYWKQLQELKAAAVCTRLYRNRMAKWVRAVELVKAVASSGAIAAWVVWKQYPFIWSFIIASAQLLDALKGVFPFSRHHKSAGDLTAALELLYIDAEQDWENIAMGEMPAQTINKRRAQLRKLQLDAEKKHFPEGFEPNARLIQLATEETRTYFRLTYSEEPSS